MTETQYEKPSKKKITLSEIILKTNNYLSMLPYVQVVRL